MATVEISEMRAIHKGSEKDLMLDCLASMSRALSMSRKIDLAEYTGSFRSKMKSYFNPSLELKTYSHPIYRSEVVEVNATINLERWSSSKRYRKSFFSKIEKEITRWITKQ